MFTKRSEFTPKQRPKFENYYLKVGKLNYLEMKNLFLSVVLLLTVSFALAANDVENVSTADIATVEMISSVELATADFTMENDITYTISSEAEVAGCGFPVYWDTDEGSGSFWLDCDDDTTMDDVIDLILELFF